MKIKYLAKDWLKDEKKLVDNMTGTYKEFYSEFGEAVEADVETFEGINFPAEPTLVEDIVTDRAGQYMCSDFVKLLGSPLAIEVLNECESEDDVNIADDVMEELNEVLWASEFYKEWQKEHPGVQCYVGYWEGGIGVLMDVYA